MAAIRVGREVIPWPERVLFFCGKAIVVWWNMEVGEGEEGGKGGLLGLKLVGKNQICVAK